MDYALKVVAAAGRVEAVREFVRALIGSEETDGFVREQLRRRIDSLSGILVRNFAPGCGAEDTNLVLGSWADRLPCLVGEIDDHG